MFVLPSRFTELVLEHRHADGSWAALERSHHDAADHDPEREWRNDGIFVCTTCDEQVRVSLSKDAEAGDAAS